MLGILPLIAAACSSNPSVAAPTLTTPVPQAGAADPTPPDPVATTESATTTGPTTTESTTTTEPTTTTAEPDPIGDVISAMSVEAKIGQLLMPVIAGTAASGQTADQAARNQALAGYDSPAEIVAAYHLGGIMYLGPNVQSASQIGAFSQGLQQAAADAGVLPLLIAADQEGGRVRRIRGEGVTEVGTARSLAGDGEAVENLARITAEEMGAIGINVVFAPVADVARNTDGVIGDRSYGADPDLVSQMVTASVRGLQSGGAIAVAKHWPGHGATALDSHAELPVVAETEEEWRQVDRVPFVAAIDGGVNAVMVGHLSYPALDPTGNPATLSRPMVEGLLREELGFDGLVVTDALDMGAVKDVPLDVRVLRAVLAGVDLLLVPPNLQVTQESLLAATASGVLSEERLDASVRRVLEMKQRLGLVAGG